MPNCYYTSFGCATEGGIDPATIQMLMWTFTHSNLINLEMELQLLMRLQGMLFLLKTQTSCDSCLP
jgi:hypothetical protein